MVQSPLFSNEYWNVEQPSNAKMEVLRELLLPNDLPLHKRLSQLALRSTTTLMKKERIQRIH